MKQKNIEYYFNIFKAFQAPMSDPALASRRQYGIRAFSSTQGWLFENTWRVVGITKDALEAFKLVNFERIPTRKDPIAVERAHINKRADWLNEMFAREWNDPQEWWDFIHDNDKVVLATAAENSLSDQKGIPLEIAFEIPDNGEYFTTNYIGCKYRKKIERNLLEDFAKSYK